MKFLREGNNAYQYNGHTVIQTSSGYRIKDGKDSWIGGEFDTDVDAKEYIDGLKESLNDSSEYTYVASKSVLDSDGFYTDYTWYKSSDGLNVFVFGDSDLYRPDDGNFDWEEEDDEAAQEWFDSYSGFDGDFLEESATEDKPVELKLSGNMIEIPIEDKSEVGELGHPIQHGIGDPRRKREVLAQESTRRWAREGLTESLWEKGDSVTLWWSNPQWSETSPSFAACMYAGQRRDGKYRFISDTYGWTYLLDVDAMTITTPKGKTYPVFNDNGWLKDTIQERWIAKYIPERGDEVTIIGSVFKDRFMKWGTETDEFIGARGKIVLASSRYSAFDEVEIELEDGTKVWTVAGYRPVAKNPLKESQDELSTKDWPDDKVLTYEEALKYALAYYGVGGDSFYETTDKAAFDYMVKEFGPMTVAKMKRDFLTFDEVAKDRMTESYNIQFYQIFSNPEKPTDNGKMIAQAGTEDEAKAKGDKLVGKGNYLIKAVCDDGKVRDVDLHDYFNKSKDLKEYYRGEDALDDVLSWLQDRKQAWNDFTAHFSDVEDEDLTYDIVIDWISENETLYDDYLGFFGDEDDLSESLGTVYNVGDRVKQKWANPYNVGEVINTKQDPQEGSMIQVKWDYSDGPDVEWLNVDEVSPYNEEDEKAGYYESLEGMHTYNVTFYMDSLDDNVISGPTTTKKIQAASEEEAKKKLIDSSTDKYYIPTVTKVELVEAAHLSDAMNVGPLKNDFMPDSADYDRWDRISDDEEAHIIAPICYMYGVTWNKAHELLPTLSAEEIEDAKVYYNLRDLPSHERLAQFDKYEKSKMNESKSTSEDRVALKEAKTGQEYKGYIICYGCHETDRWYVKNSKDEFVGAQSGYSTEPEAREAIDAMNESLTEAFQMTIDLDMLASDVGILLDADVLGYENWIEVFPIGDSRPIGNNGYILPLEITGPNDDCRKATFSSRGGVVDVRFRNGSEAKCYDAKEIARFIAGEFGVTLNESLS